MKAKDYTELRFNKLVFIRKTKKRKYGKLLWEIQCDCGKKIFRRACDIKTPKIKSCGCSQFKNKVKDYTGLRFNKLVFVGMDRKSKSGHMMWKIKCDCGKLFYSLARHIVLGRTKSCGCSRAKDYTGLKINKLTFIKPHSKKKGTIIWELQCDCGKMIYYPASEITSNKKVKSCGCHRAARIQSGEIGRIYDPMISSAKMVYARSYTDIDFDIFYKLSQLDCYYCGRPPYNIYKVKRKKISNYQRNNGDFTYNGLDRVDNSKGHSPDNVVPCCKDCNTAKMAMKQEDFFALIKLIYERHIKD